MESLIYLFKLLKDYQIIIPGFYLCIYIKMLKAAIIENSNTPLGVTATLHPVQISLQESAATAHLRRYLAQAPGPAMIRSFHE